MIGSLLYITRTTRPEISIHINLLGRRAQDPSVRNMQVARQTLSYVNSTKHERLLLRKSTKDEGLEVKIYVDAAYGEEESKSQTGVIVTLGGQPINWYTRKQDIVTLSSSEAEYIAACEAAKDASWTRQLLQEFQMTEIPTILTDNESAYNLAKTQAFRRRSRHIEHRYHYLRQEVNKGHVKVRTVPGKQQQADILTKITPMSSIISWKEKWMILRNGLEI
jgi:hypothetical protein